jgi:hypothetical protein
VTVYLEDFIGHEIEEGCRVVVARPFGDSGGKLDIGTFVKFNPETSMVTVRDDNGVTFSTPFRPNKFMRVPDEVYRFPEHEHCYMETGYFSTVCYYTIGNGGYCGRKKNDGQG